MDQKTLSEARAQCTRFVWGNYPRTPHDILTELSAFAAPSLESDIYGKGALIEEFEAEVAQLLGKPAAVFMPSGTMAQQIALRIWAERTGSHYVAFHPTCHLELHEEQGYRELHHLQGILVGDRYRLMTLDDLQNVHVPLGALLLELPQRHLGGALPPWDDLTAITQWAHERGIIMHMDGARLWECQPFYGHSYAEIAALFDTVYVSFYKVLDGITGALLAGPEDVIAEARVWLRRHGGNLIRLYPFVLAAKIGLDTRLGRMAAYHAKAVDIAAALAPLPEIEIVPNPPHTNMMQIYLRADPDRLQAAAVDIAYETQTWLLFKLASTPIPAYQLVELTIADAALDLDTDEIAALYTDLIHRATR